SYGYPDRYIYLGFPRLYDDYIQITIADDRKQFELRRDFLNDLWIFTDPGSYPFSQIDEYTKRYHGSKSTEGLQRYLEYIESFLTGAERDLNQTIPTYFGIDRDKNTCPALLPGAQEPDIPPASSPTR